MKAVQDALKPTGIPAYATAWKPTAAHKTAPDKYLVYTTMTTEDSHHDDDLQVTRRDHRDEREERKPHEEDDQRKWICLKHSASRLVVSG